MPFISEAASAIKSRFGFHNPSESARATPDVSNRSSFRENLSQFSAIRTFNDRDESRDANSSKGSEMVVRSFELIEEPSFWKDHNVQVIIRLRPLSSSEISSQGYSRCVRQESHQTVTWTGHPETRFTFDLVADETVSQEKLFSVAGVPMVENCVNGYNSCMFAYGQTGSGKTHTMLGDIEGGTRRHSVNSGMTPRVFDHLFSRIQKEKETRREEKMRFTCKCSFLEIYNEHILDLLNPSSSNLHIREDLKKGVYVENLTEIEVSTARDVMQQLQEGSVNRKVAATNMNHASSRSHSVFTCVIESSWESQGVTHHRFARLNLVDLAGSERQKSSGAEGERLREATNINKSLSTLGLVIMNLVSLSNGKTLHVPYRDSKLTFLLQDSLGGNSKTIIIANISPANSCTLETLSTLKFAQRAKFIKNNAIVNEDASGDVIAMRMQIQQLKKEVTHLRSLTGGASVQDGDSMSMGLLGSPGAFQWEGLNAGAFSPLMSDKRLSQKKEYEAALIGAFRRVKDKDIALQALTAENQTVMQVAKQREEELKALNLRLRFRESGIKRLEAVASGKLSAETHLLQEKEELLKEIEVMRSQVNKKQEVTRFAMENLRLNEEIRRLKSFYEEGERERMSEQIMILENKLLEALDWKLMNEPNCTTPKDKTPTVHSAVNEENEFLRLQAIHNQGEIDLLRKKLQKLERHVKNTEAETEDKNGASGDIRNVSVADQMELKAMVDAIAAASQREAEAHEMAITWSRETAELRSRVKVLIEDNKKLIELYESAVTEINNKTNACETMVEDDSAVPTDVKAIYAQKLQDLEHQLAEMHEENERLMGMYERAVTEFNNKTSTCETMVEDDSTVIDEKVIDAQKVQDLEHQLTEMHEENERLMGMYEKAMLERVSSTVIDSHEQAVTETEEKDGSVKKMEDMEHQLQELHEENYRLMSMYEKAMLERVSPMVIDSHEQTVTETEEKDGSVKKMEDMEHQLQELHEENDRLMSMYEKAMLERVSPTVIDSHEQTVTETEEKDGSVKKMEDMEHQLQELHEENERLMGMYEKAMLEKVSPTVIDTHEQTVTETQEKDGSVKKMEDMEHQLWELHEENERLMSLYETAMQERDEFKKISSSGVKRNHDSSEEVESVGDKEEIVEMETDENSSVLIKLDEVKEKLSSSTQFVAGFEVLEKAVFEVDQIISESEGTTKEIQANQEMLRSLNAKAVDLQERSDVIDKQFSALKFSLSNISSSTGYFEERELKAIARVESSLAYLNQMKEELTSLEAQKGETEAVLMKNDQAAAEIKANLAGVESKLEEENRKLESDKVLFAIDNIDKRSWKMGTTELLKSAEEKTKLQNEIKQCNVKLKTISKQTVNLKSKVMKVETDIERVSMEIQKASDRKEKMELALNNATTEKESLLELKDNGNIQVDEMVIKFHQFVFDAQLNDEERKTVEAEVSDLAMKLEKLQGDKAAVMKMMTQKLKEGEILSSEKMKGELEEVSMSLLEAEQLLGKCC